MTQKDIEGSESQEMEYVEELRNQLKGMMTPEMYADNSVFIRFLRARNYDLKAAENMLKNHVNWRKNNDIDGLLTRYKPHEVAEKYIPFGQLCVDKDGAPVIYSQFGNLDTRGCLKAIKMSDITDYFTRSFENDVETLKSQSTKLNKNIDQWTYIFNMENFSLASATHKPTLETIGKMIMIYEANYPERLKAAFVINASWIFQLGFAVIKPVFSGRTLQKIKIYGKDGWKEDLLKHIDADELPAFLGGNRTDPDGDPMCKSFVKHGGLVPEHYYAVHRKIKFGKKPGVKKITIQRLSKERVALLVTKPGSDIEYEFETKKHDIAVSLLYQNDENGDLKEVMPKQRFDTTLSTESGIFKCDKIGTYFLEFDNTYSWIYRKEVYYKVEVNIPKDMYH